jgi:hypothetical protein
MTRSWTHVVLATSTWYIWKLTKGQIMQKCAHRWVSKCSTTAVLRDRSWYASSLNFSCCSEDHQLQDRVKKTKCWKDPRRPTFLVGSFHNIRRHKERTTDVAGAARERDRAFPTDQFLRAIKATASASSFLRTYSPQRIARQLRQLVRRKAWLKTNHDTRGRVDATESFADRLFSTILFTGHLPPT